MLIKKRVDEIDIIRGFALFGVLLVNLTMIDSTRYSLEHIPFKALSGMELISAWAIRLLAQGKFYTIFSFLFGLGFYYFLQKKDTEETIKRFKRRLYVLLIMGTLHTVFVWYGDILHVYAIAGFILIKNKDQNDNSIIRIMILLFIFSTSIMMLGSQASSPDIPLAASSAFSAYQQNSYFEMLLYRIQYEVPIGLINLIVVIPKVLVLFYAGYFVGRKGWFNELQTQRVRIWRYGIISGIIFLISISMMLILSSSNNPYAFKVLTFFEELSTMGGSVFYMTTILLMSQSKSLKKVLLPLKNLGKMALTNYLMQTIVWTTFFYGYGGGYFGKTPYYLYFPMTIGFIVLQILLSNLWLSRFEQGPMEKLWRMAYKGNS